MLESPEFNNDGNFTNESMKAFKSILRILDLDSFKKNWPFTFNFTLEFVSTQKAKDHIERDFFGGENNEASHYSESQNSQREDEDYSDRHDG